MNRKSDEALIRALQKAYTARARFFFTEVQARAVEKLISEVENIKGSELTWTLPALGISALAFSKLQKAGTPPHYIFAHPEILRSNPRLEQYYRNLAALSKKGLSQILPGTNPQMGRPERIAFILNSIVSQIVEVMKGFRLDLARSVIFAEIGTEVQGSWVNIIGQGAARNVEKILKSHAEANGFLKRPVSSLDRQRPADAKARELLLNNGWKIIFGSEPDVAIFDKPGQLRMAIEIKGSMDKAGAQTRYGEAKKSFAKALAANPRCETIYLASCFTEAVERQVKADGQVRKIYNLIDVLDDPRTQTAFLEEIFKFHIRIQK